MASPDGLMSLRGDRGTTPGVAESAVLSSPKVPGGSFLAALNDRRLQAWSDRGGASREIGERWSKLVAEELSNLVGQTLTFGGARATRLQAVLWLDGRPEIARRAGRHGLPSPDFMLAYESHAGTLVLQPADAKFSVQKVKFEQISARTLRALLDSRDPALLEELSLRLPRMAPGTVDVIDGVVVSPAGVLTEYYLTENSLSRVVAGSGTRLRREQLVTLAADPRRLFAGLSVARLVGLLAAVDRLPVRPSTDLVAAVYYVRLACACRWLWEEAQRPLLALESQPPADLEGLFSEAATRARHAEAAFEMVERWAQETKEIRRTREMIARLTNPPLPTAELRELFTRAGLVPNRRLEQQIRGELSGWYRRRLIERVGEIPARPSRPIVDFLQELARQSRELQPLIRRWLDERLLAEG